MHDNKRTDCLAGDRTRVWNFEMKAGEFIHIVSACMYFLNVNQVLPELTVHDYSLSYILSASFSSSTTNICRS